jgi:hypothetical protein
MPERHGSLPREDLGGLVRSDWFIIPGPGKNRAARRIRAFGSRKEPVKPPTSKRFGMLGLLLAAVLPVALSSVVLAEQLTPVSPECPSTLPVEPCPLPSTGLADVVSGLQGQLVGPNPSSASQNEPADGVGFHTPTPTPSPPQVRSGTEVAPSQEGPGTHQAPAPNPAGESHPSVTGADIARALAGALISLAVGIAAVTLSRARIAAARRS